MKVIRTVEQQALGTQEPSCSSVPQVAMANLESIDRSKFTIINLACFLRFHRRGKLPIMETESVSKRPCMLCSPPVHCENPGIVCPACNPSCRVGGGEDDGGVAVVVHPRVVAEPIVGHDRSVTI